MTHRKLLGTARLLRSVVYTWTSVALLALAVGSGACGGSDVVDVTQEAGLDAAGFDGPIPPGQDAGDATLNDGGKDGGDAGKIDGGDAGKTDGGDAAVTDGGDAGDADASDGGGCLITGSACTQPGECCTNTCTNNVCNVAPCISDNGACTTNASCCGGQCANNLCTPLNVACRTLGNTCTSNAQCCSTLCQNGVCSAASYCGQQGDVCATNNDCCGGLCVIAADAGATLGVCGQPPPGPANCSMVDGTVCGGVAADGGIIVNDAGLPSCGGNCCSRLCAPYGPTGVLICQPAEGCHVVGDLCIDDTNCCGAAPGSCSITPPYVIGVCRNPSGCKPNGDVCRLSTMSCSASCDCCAGNCIQFDTCKQDLNGVPRCANLVCVGPGQSCATSADCCNSLPCVPNPNYGDGGAGDAGDGGDASAPPQFICGATTCVPTGGLCTSSADCCPGETCIIPQGGTSGICGIVTIDGGVITDAAPPPDAGPTDGAPSDAPIDAPCASYGQICTTNANCCNGVPCTGGRCITP